MLTGAEIERRRSLLGEGDLPALLETLRKRCADWVAKPIVVPNSKAELSIAGGICPACSAPLVFDPEAPAAHRCSRCDEVARGARHDGHWVRGQHLWVAERAAELAAVAALTDDQTLATSSRDLLRRYYRLYHEIPNRDNTLGPSHLFFSTYLESIWVLNYLAAAFLLRERGWLGEDDLEAVNAIADEAAALIGDFNEGLSNRQTWNAAALVAIAVWFGDEELAETASHGRSGLLGHLTDGFDDDGMWHEGENYHLFALRGLLIGIDWCRAAGIELLEDAALAEQLRRALLAPSLTALPDGTFPARRDSRYGVSLSHPAYLECWERGVALSEHEDRQDDGDDLVSWLAERYRRPSAPGQTYDAYLHDAGRPARERSGRTDLSWWMLLTMAPTLPEAAARSTPGSRLLAAQGVAVLRQHDRYLSVECGSFAGGHGHPDRLHLSLFADGVAWLADPGTGSYQTRDLFWYRSTLAHNAPRLDGQSQQSTESRPVAFAENGDWGWVVAEHGPIRRAVIHGPEWLLDVVDLDGGDTSRVLELPWHLDGDLEFASAGDLEPAALADEFVTDTARFVPAAGTDPVAVASKDGKRVRLHLVGGEVLRAVGPGRPGEGRRPFVVARQEGTKARLVAVADFSGTVSRVDAGDAIVVHGRSPVSVRLGGSDATVTVEGKAIQLGGALARRPAPKPLMAERPIANRGEALRIVEVPPCDGTLAGFEDCPPLVMADEAHYYRTEEPYSGEEQFSAQAWVGWDNTAWYLAVRVTKPEVCLGPAVPPPLGRDNEADDIHYDGIQVYYRALDGAERGYLIRPAEGGGIFARPIPGSPATPSQLDGSAAVLDDGYLLTVALPCPELGSARVGSTVAFDLVVNEMRSDRATRAGQLAWGGGSGWAYLRGDRRDPSLWGELELLG